MDLRVFGLTSSLMRQVTQYQDFTGSVIHNDTVTLTASDENGMSTAWVGPIQDAWIDFTASPNVCLHILSLTVRQLAH